MAQAQQAAHPEPTLTGMYNVLSAPVAKTPWPVGLPQQIKAVAEVLAGSGRALSLADPGARFNARGRSRDPLPTIPGTLEALGSARRVGLGADQWQSG